MTTFVNSWHRRKLKSSRQYLAIQNPALMIVTVMKDTVSEEDMEEVADEVFPLDVVQLIVKKLHNALLSRPETTRLQPLE